MALDLHENRVHAVSLVVTVSYCVPALYQVYFLIGCFITDVVRRNATTRAIFTFGLHQVSYKQNDLTPEVV